MKDATKLEKSDTSENETNIRKNITLVKSPLMFQVGAVLDITGKVQKVVKRDGQCKLIIEPCNAPGFAVFADCTTEAEKIRESKIRKGSLVAIRGKLQSYGARGICLSDCRL
jgi:hypothetical protein